MDISKISAFLRGFRTLILEDAPVATTEEEPLTWQSFWQKIVDFFTTNVHRIILWFIVLVAGIILINAFVIIMRRIMRARKVDPIAIRFVCRLVRFSLWLILIVILIAMTGIPVTGMTTALSAAVLAIGVALRDLLANVAAGIVLVISKTFKKGDYIQSTDCEGNVVDVNFLFTSLKTVDSTKVIVPNAQLIKARVVNLGAYPLRRVAIIFSVDLASDTKVVKETMLDVMKSDGRIYLDPPPLCRLKTISDSTIDYFCTCYCDNSNYWDVYFYIMDMGFDRLKAAGVVFPFKQVSISQHKETAMPIEREALPERVEIEHPEFIERDSELFAMDEAVEAKFKKAQKKMKDKQEKSDRKAEKKEEKAEKKQEKRNKKKDG